jgi:uncharacterized protein YjbJ (UPF0337 family)
MKSFNNNPTEVEIMNKEQVKGTIDDAVGRAKRQVGEWTDNSNQIAEGAAQQVKGKAEKAFGNVKDAAQQANRNITETVRNFSERDRQENRQENKDANRNSPPPRSGTHEYQNR